MPNCPHCKIELPEQDFNVATDKAYCRLCKKTFTFNEAVTAPGRKFNPGSPPAHVTVVDRGDGAVLSYRKIPWFVFLVIPFAAIWVGVMTTVIAKEVMKKGFGPEIFFFFPVAIAVVVMFGGIIFMLFGRTEIREKSDGLEFFTGAFGFGRRKMIRFSEIDHAKVTTCGVNNMGGRQPMRIRVCKKDGNSIGVCHFIGEDGADYFCSFINSKR